MKKRIILQSFICLLAASCTVNELDVVPPPTPSEEMVFYASLESYSEPDTKVHINIDESIKVLWDADDRISIFNMSTLNQQFGFDGETDDNGGTFHWIENDYFGAGNDLNYICAVYPYQESTTISNSGVLTLNLPAEQTYREDSFGPGANTMVSVTEDNVLKFKNVGGYLVLKFYGTDVSISSITLVGHHGEKLSGEATWKPVIGATPENITMTATTGTSVTLKCDTPVVLGEEPTVFWIVVPPTLFTEGFRLIVTDPDGNSFIKDTNKELSIVRNSVLRVAPIQVSMNSADLSIDDVYSADKNKLPSKTDYDGDSRKFTVTMPTLDRSHLVLDYEFSENCSLMANGMDVIPGETPIDVSKPVTLTVRNNNYGKNYTLIARNTGLPIVRITLKGISLQALEDEPNSLQSEDKLDHRVWHSGTTVRIENADGSAGMNQVLDDGYSKVPVYTIATQIKGRGNYSWKWEKKPYALKFDSKREVLGMPAHKRWVLLANWRDRTLLRNDATFWLAKKAKDELPYTTRGQFVELEINGEYRGNYYLCEQIKIDENRVAITEIGDNAEDPTGGFLMEIDSYFDEINKFLSEPFGLRYMFKEPDEDVTALEADDEIELARNYRAAYAWMKNRINAFETVLKTKSAVEGKQYEDYLDVDSAIMFMLLNELVANGDFFQTSNDEVFGPHSTYLYKNRGADAKIYMGPVWDFDYLTFTPTTSWRGFTSNKYYYYYMCHNQDFVNRIQSLWTEYKTVFAGLPDYIDDMVTYLTDSQKFDEERWPYDSQYDNTTQKNRNDNKDYGLSYADAITRMKQSFNNRLTWLNGKINDLSVTTPSGRYRYGTWVPGEWLYP